MFLSLKITNQGISNDTEILKKVQDFPHPKNEKEIQSCLGLSNCFSRFSKKYA